jgi:hypothetical protein
MVRHTETVQVTTRHTIVDPHADDGPRVGGGTVYGAPGFERGRPETPDFIARPEVAPRSRTEPRGVGAGPVLRGSHDRSVDPVEESWTEQRLREQLERRREVAEPVQRDASDRWPSRESWTERPDTTDRWSERAEPDRWAERDDDDDRRPGLRAGDRWASVRSDDRGRELRVGERRAALHSDESGTELRIEDRWAAVRREDARTGAGSWRDDDDRLDEPRAGFPWRDADRDPPRVRDADWRESDRGDRADRGDRRAITGSDAGDRWPDYDDYDERDRDRRRR